MQYYDAERGKHYNYFRDYDPAIGRYIESDPIGLRGGINTYAYVEGGPLGMSDRLGLATQMCTRRLNNVPFRAGPLFHQMICTGGGCGGLSPSGSMLDSPGVIEREPPSGICKKVEEDNQCIETCIQDEFKKPPPNYSVHLANGDNCQTWADRTLMICRAKCKGKK